MLKNKLNLRKVATMVACLAVTSMMFLSCSKENSDNPLDPNNPDNPDVSDIRLVSYLRIDNSDGVATYNYVYDGQNRLTKVTAAGGANAGVWTVTYPSANIIRYDNNTNYMKFTKTRGYVTKYEAKISGAEVNQVLEYSGGHLVKTINDVEGMSVVNTYAWSGDNLSAVEEVMQLPPPLPSMTTRKITFSYTATPNKQGYISPWTISHDDGNWICPAYWAGKMSPNLVSSRTQEVFGMSTTTSTYRYEKDTEDYVTKVYVREDGGAEKLLYEVHYYDNEL